jgi:hypothetical protein
LYDAALEESKDKHRRGNERVEREKKGGRERKEEK